MIGIKNAKTIKSILIDQLRDHYLHDKRELQSHSSNRIGDKFGSSPVLFITSVRNISCRIPDKNREGLFMNYVACLRDSKVIQNMIYSALLIAWIECMGVENRCH
jgi:hypothetical protein